MLLIGQPKSATTSFMWSISEALKIPHKNGQNRKRGDMKCHGYKELQKYHGTMVRRSLTFLYKYISTKDIIYKEHILPTKDHLEFIDSIELPVVVLLRDAAQTVESYKRVFSVLPEIKINYDKLKEELEMFQNIYLKKEKENKIYKIIYFRDLIKSFTKTLECVILHYKLEVPKDIKKLELAKRNYTWR